MNYVLASTKLESRDRASVAGVVTRGFVLLLLLVGLVSLPSCATPLYSSAPSDGVVEVEDPAAELVEWLDATCRLAHEHAWWGVRRADYNAASGWSSHTRAEFMSSLEGKRVGLTYALEVTLPWTPYVLPRGHYSYTESDDTHHASGDYLPPVWIEDGAERAAVTDWLNTECSNILGDPYSEKVDYSPDLNAWERSAVALIETEALLVTATLPPVEDRHPKDKKCDTADRVCPAGTVFS